MDKNLWMVNLQNIYSHTLLICMELAGGINSVSFVKLLLEQNEDLSHFPF